MHAVKHNTQSNRQAAQAAGVTQASGHVEPVNQLRRSSEMAIVARAGQGGLAH